MDTSMTHCFRFYVLWHGGFMTHCLLFYVSLYLGVAICLAFGVLGVSLLLVGDVARRGCNEPGESRNQAVCYEFISLVCISRCLTGLPSL
jgi:hypothetical protein